MMLPLHITIAFSSLLLAALSYFYPSYLKLRITYGLILATFATGFVLIWLNRPVHMTKVCITGLTYLAVVIYVVVSVRQKLTKQI
jgi:hypothetical protein